MFVSLCSNNAKTLRLIIAENKSVVTAFLGFQ